MQELGLIRKPASFMTSICDERGQELLYAGMPISDVSKDAIQVFNDLQRVFKINCHILKCSLTL